jgi:hypothetical protein
VQYFLDEVETMMAAGPHVYDTGDNRDSGYAYTEVRISEESSLSMIEKLGIYLLILLVLGGIVIGGGERKFLEHHLSVLARVRGKLCLKIKKKRSQTWETILRME